MRSVGSWLSHPSSLRAFVSQMAETDETWESGTNAFFDDGSCVIWLLVCLPFSVSSSVSVCVLCACSLCTCCLCACGCKTGSTGPVWSLIDFYIRNYCYYWVVGMNSQECTLPGGCITYHWAFLQSCCNVLATWYCCHNALTILFCHFVVCSVLIKGPITQYTPHF